MSEEPLSSSQLRDALRQANIEAIFPQSSAYISPTPRNKRLTVYPEAITFPINARDVAEIVKIGARFQRRVVALSGGHSAIANGIGGSNQALVIDFSKMKAVSYNSSNKHITFQTGNKLKDVVVALQTYRRAFAHGVCDGVGIGGHPAFGGFGLASRMWGLNCDAIQSIDVVLENGTQRTISADNAGDRDLFWAMRGAAPSYAIATSITYRTFDPPPSASDYKFSCNLSYQDAARVVFDFQRFANDGTRVPRELGFQFRIDRGRQLGGVNLTISGTYFGPQHTFDTVIKPFLRGLIPIDPIELTDDSNRTRFPAADPTTFFQKGYGATLTGDYFSSVVRSAADVTLTGDSIQYARVLDEVNWTGPETDLSYIRKVVTPGLPGVGTNAPDRPHPDPLICFYIKTLMTPALSLDALTELLRVAAIDGFGQNLNWFVTFKLFGGPNSAISEGDSSFAWRNAMWFMEFDADSDILPYPDSGYRFLDSLVKSITATMSGTTFGAYPGFLDDRLENFQQFYYGANYARLRQIKQASARSEVFSFPQSIPPA